MDDRINFMETCITYGAFDILDIRNFCIIFVRCNISYTFENFKNILNKNSIVSKISFLAYLIYCELFYIKNNMIKIKINNCNFFISTFSKFD